jgi:ornithine decarboxylase
MKQNLKNTKLNVELTKEIINEAFISSKINSRGREDKDDAFFIADLSDIVRKYKIWKRELPRVEPFYAVKCNDNIGVLSVLAQLGTGFDCASKAEISKMMDLKVSPNRVIYANPCKQNSHIRYAAKHDVALMTFDNIPELHKVKTNHPNAKLVVRILPPDDTKAQCQLGMKFGAHPKDVPKLLKTAKDLGLNVVGVSFHVGSGCYDPAAFPAAIASARTVFDMGEKAGFQFDFLDIGGGFPGQKTSKISFEGICGPLKAALDAYFPESKGVRIIAEPGRFFVASAFTLAVNIIAKRAVLGHEVADDYEGHGDVEPKFMYYVNDGVYGSFNCLMFDHATVEAELVHPEDYEDEPRFTCSIWGPTCDGIDCIKEETVLPEMDAGDWLLFRDMGAYTMCAASSFNGMPKPRSYYIMQESAWIQMQTNSNEAELRSCSLSSMKSPLVMELSSSPMADHAIEAEN